MSHPTPEIASSDAKAPSPGPATADRAAADRATTDRGWSKARYLLLSLAILVLDQWSKWLVELHLGSHASVEVIPGLLALTHVKNTGVAFGLFATHGSVTGTAILTLLGIGALLFVGYYFWLAPRADRMLLAALALILGGAVGNLCDRVLRGAVTDFVDFYFGTYHWHTFNVADSAITIGIALMILGAFRHPEPVASASG